MNFDSLHTKCITYNKCKQSCNFSKISSWLNGLDVMIMATTFNDGPVSWLFKTKFMATQ